MLKKQLATPATTLGNPKILSSKPLDSKDARYVELNELLFRASNGSERRWEAANRKTRSEDVIADAVDIFTHITHPSLPTATIIVLQYRAPVDAITVEFPAGLIDAGESPQEAALRELAEETGYGAKDSPETRGSVVHVSKVCADSPGEPHLSRSLHRTVWTLKGIEGMSSETTVFVRIDVQLSADLQNFPEPKQNLDEGEFIEKRVVPLKDLYETLEAYADLGYAVDTRLHHLAYGLTISKTV